MTWSHNTDTAAGTMECFPLTPDRFVDMETVFGPRGVARRCFCMYWRRPNGGFADDRDNRDRFANIASAGPPPGLLGYVNGEPKGWVQVGPRSEFPTLSRSRLLKPVDDVEPWTINCFVVRAGERRQGIGRGLLEAAVEYAKSQGAVVIEAYPVDGNRESVVDYFTGTLPMFTEHGFTEIIRRNDTRPIVRLTV
ncbi:MAG TPA: GNAT family N-acetyltransferase [Acidimicrobiia bacterium]|nr:GNAT family N-acetyltransferase [Acidimicrobiia bacterium]